MRFFFFQAEDGIRDLTVTGVQTCALPICQAEPGHGRQSLRRLGERAEQKNAEGRDVSANVVTKAGAGGPQSRGEEFRKINRVTAERRKNAEADDRPQIPDLRRPAEGGKSPDQTTPGQHQRDQKRNTTPASRREGRETGNAQKCADLLQNATDGLQSRLLIVGNRFFKQAANLFLAVGSQRRVQLPDRVSLPPAPRDAPKENCEF